MLSSWQVSLHAWWPYLIHIYLYAFRSTSYSFSTRTISVYYCVLSIYALISLQRLSFPGPIIHMCAQYFCCNNIYDRSIAPSMILFAFMKIELWIDRWIDLQYKHDIIGFMRVDREARPKASRLRMCTRCDFYPCCLVPVLIARCMHGMQHCQADAGRHMLSLQAWTPPVCGVGYVMRNFGTFLAAASA